MYLRHRLSVGGFSLVEVIVAVGIFAVSIIAVIGLLGPTNQNIANVRGTDDATRVVTAIQTELQRIAELPASSSPSAPSGWNQLTGGAGATNRLIRTSVEVKADDDNVNFNPGATTYTFFASRGGDKIGAYSSSVWDPDNKLSQTAEDAFKFFEVVLIRNGDFPTVGNGLSPAANDASAGYLAYTIRLRWPAYMPDGERVVDNNQKSILIFPGAVHR